MATTKRKRANGKQSGHWIRPQRRLAIYLRDKFTCQYCGKDLHNVPAHSITLDHLKPRIKGGNHESNNLVTACHACNSKRQDKPWRSYATGGAIERITRTVRRKVNIDLALAIIKGESPDPRLEDK